MIKPDYTNVDTAILAAIITGCHRMVNIEGDWSVKQAVQKVHVESSLDRPHHRTIDARLQALKKQGKVVFTHTYGWRIKSQREKTS